MGDRRAGGDATHPSADVFVRWWTGRGGPAKGRNANSYSKSALSSPSNQRNSASERTVLRRTVKTESICLGEQFISVLLS